MASASLYIPTQSQMFLVSSEFQLTHKQVCMNTCDFVMCLATFLNVDRHYNQYIVNNNNNFFFALLCGWLAAGTWRRSTALRQTKNNGYVLCPSCIFVPVILSRSLHSLCMFAVLNPHRSTYLVVTGCLWPPYVIGGPLYFCFFYCFYFSVISIF